MLAENAYADATICPVRRGLVGELYEGVEKMVTSSRALGQTSPAGTSGADPRIAEWAARLPSERDVTRLEIDHLARGLAVHGAVGATGEPLVTIGEIGADLLRLEAGAGFLPHTHPGHHVLVVVGGSGTLVYAGEVIPTEAGEIYIVEGNVPHAVGARTSHVILAVGAPHKHVAALDRMAAVPYQEVLTPLGSLSCRICGILASEPTLLHEMGCPHCPCELCVRTIPKVTPSDLASDDKV